MTSTDPNSVLVDQFTNLEKAWNTADGPAYGQEFTPDADFVDIRGTHHTGRDAIGAGHQAIFDSIYANRVIHYDVTDSRLLAPGCIAGHATAHLQAPNAPPMPSEHARCTVVATASDEGWKIAAFHNTLITET